MKKAVNFNLPDKDGKMHQLSDYLGKKVVLYFYPKDNTPGCTKQACSYSANYPAFLEKGAVVLGISKDTVASHKRFEEKQNLAFTILADPELKVIQAYDVWKEKKNYGKVSMGVVRTTFLIDEQGNIEKVMPKVKPDTDAETDGVNSGVIAGDGDFCTVACFTGDTFDGDHTVVDLADFPFKEFDHEFGHAA